MPSFDRITAGFLPIVALTAILATASCRACFAAASRAELIGIVRNTMELYYQRKASRDNLQSYIKELAERNASPAARGSHDKPAGVFVTLSLNGKTRACWGSITPQYDSIASGVVYATLGALTKEYRFEPIRRSELRRLKPQVTLIRSVDPIKDTGQINPFTDGLMVRSGGKSGVILPGEATDAYYELVLAKLKAGIKPGEPFQLYKLKAEIYD